MSYLVVIVPILVIVVITYLVIVRGKDEQLARNMPMVKAWADGQGFEVVLCESARKYEYGPFVLSGRWSLVYFVTILDGTRQRRSCWIKYPPRLFEAKHREPIVIWQSDLGRADS